MWESDNSIVWMSVSVRVGEGDSVGECQCASGGE